MSDPSAPTILLVEDNIDDVILTRRALRKVGVSAALATVGDGEEAKAYLLGTGAFADRNAHPMPALVLLDWKLPRCSGVEVLDWIRARSEMDTLPVVVLTSSRQQEDIEQAYAAGANSYLQKPVAFSELVELLGRLHLYWFETNITAAR
jgi:CheY-like chemotaxis protein